MTERDNILGRIREALRLKAPRPGAHDGSEPAGHLPTPAEHRAVLPVVGTSVEDWGALFARNCAELRADFKSCRDADDLAAELARLRDTEGWTHLASHRHPLTTTAAAHLGLPVFWTDAGYDKHALERCDAGLTVCDALVAQTGTVVVSTRTAGGRALSVLPPHHVVLATRDQLVPDLPSAFVELKTRYGAAFPSMISFITGPSRTGDIERILVLGAHGPKKLTILCV
jgi:L-lactate dehydrogenase complex protein LldG